MTAKHLCKEVDAGASLRVLRRSAVALTGALIAAGTLAVSGAGVAAAPAALDAGAGQAGQALVQPALTITGVLSDVDGRDDHEAAELVTLDQVLALLEVAEGSAHRTDRALTPEVSQAAAELGTLLHGYLAEHPDLVAPDRRTSDALAGLSPDAFEEVPLEDPALAEAGGGQAAGDLPAEPDTTTGEPGTATAEPGAATAEPETTTGEPETTTGEPGITTGGPPTQAGDAASEPVPVRI